MHTFFSNARQPAEGTQLFCKEGSVGALAAPHAPRHGYPHGRYRKKPLLDWIFQSGYKAHHLNMSIG